MTLTTESGSVLYGDWRSSAYGANRRAHLFVYAMPMDSRKSPACGALIPIDRTGKASKRKLAELCYDCLAYGASGR